MSDVAQCHVAHKLHSHIKWIRRSTAACNANKLYLSRYMYMYVTYHDNSNNNCVRSFIYLCLPLPVPVPIPLFCIICTFVVHWTNERVYVRRIVFFYFEYCLYYITYVIFNLQFSMSSVYRKWGKKEQIVEREKLKRSWIWRLLDQYCRFDCLQIPRNQDIYG